MDFFNYQNNALFAENISLSTIAAEYGTPCYVYSKAALLQQWHAFDQAFDDAPHKICYAVKANSNLAVLNLLARQGSGFDIVSIGELERVLAAGGDAKNIIFSGVGKLPHEMQRALEVGIHCFNVESETELDTLNAVAASMDVQAPISLRINPDVDAQTHPYISTGLKDNKFGIDINQALRIYLKASKYSHLNIVGLDCHIGSQLTQVTPFIDALDRLISLIQQLKQQGITLKHLDLGGGLGVCYKDETPPHPREYISAILQKLQLHDLALEVILEPGRAIAANAGVLLTQIQYLKHTEHKHFCIIDAAMNDLMRPSLYGAWQNILPIQRRHGDKIRYDIVGPVCETGDFLGKDRELNVEQGDLLAICSAGAYGFTMSSNYNSRGRAAEVMIDDDKSYLVRPREDVQSLFADEALLPNE